MITLYNMPLALNCYKVRLLLGLLNVPYERKPIDLLKGEHKTPEFLKLNPFGQLPVLTDGHIVLRDSQAIMVWLAHTFGADSWMPRDPNKEAVVHAWLAAAAFEVRLGPYDARLAKLFPWLCINPNTVVERSELALNLYNGRLKDRQWIALDHPTLADVAAFPAISQAHDGEISLKPYPAVEAWLERIRKLPGFVGILD